MEGTVCSVCGRGMSLKDLEHSAFRVINDQLVCPECALKLGQPRRLRCPGCGKQITATLRDGKYTCTHCGQEIGGQQERGVITSAQPAASRPPDTGGLEILPSRTPRRRTDRSKQVLVLLLSCFVAVTCVLGALLIRAGKTPRPEPRPAADDSRPEKDDEDKSTDRAGADQPSEQDRALFERVRKWVKSDLKNHENVVENCREAIQNIRHAVMRLDAKEALDGYEARVEQFKTLSRLRQENADLQSRLTKALDELKKSKAAKPKPDTTVHTKPNGNGKPAATTKNGPDAKKPSPAEARKAEAKKAYLAAEQTVQELIDQRKYGDAMKAMQAVVRDYQDTEWGKKADARWQQIQGNAEGEYQRAAPRIDDLIRHGEYVDARKLCAELERLGVPRINRLIAQKVRQIREAETAEPARVVPAPNQLPAQVKKLIEQLASEKEFARRDAATSLGEQRIAAAVPHLIAVLKDGRWSVRAAAALALGKLGDLRAVRPLIATLGDSEAAVTYDAHAALRALTRQTFGRGEQAKWRTWCEANVPKQPERPAPPPRKQTTFATTVRARSYSPPTLQFDLPKEAVLAAGAVVRVLHENRHLCDVSILTVTESLAHGKITRLQAGTDDLLRPGKGITVTLKP